MSRNFFSTVEVVDESVIDSTISAFNNLSYDITEKRTTRWNRLKKRENNAKQLNNTTNKHCTKQSIDRFIPIRDGNQFDQAQLFQAKDNKIKLNEINEGKQNSENIESQNNSNTIRKKKDGNQYKSLLSSDTNSKILTFQTKAPTPCNGYIANLRPLYTVNNIHNICNKKIKVRYINSSAERVLDAPDLMDDYYLNLLHWGSNNMIAVGLNNTVYLWHSENGEIKILNKYDGNSDIYVCSVKYNHNSQYIAVGTSNGIVTLYDSVTKKTLRKLSGHASRIGSLSWNHCILSTGSADSTIRNHDVRQKKSLISTFESHEQEICGLEWNNNESGKYLASGSNDNKVCIWEFGQNSPVSEFTDSLSAVKALAFCPWNNNLLATGGGSGDRKIRIYDILSGNLCNQIDTLSQVCSLIWNPFEKEILSAHGFSKYQLSIWKYPSLVKTHDLTGHKSRILHTSLSPCGQRVCSAAADETLRFWNVFEKPKNRECVNKTESDHYTNESKNQLNIRIR